ncbi:MAG: L,D-transpeptidase [Thermoleophilia bacterium]
MAARRIAAAVAAVLLAGGAAALAQIGDGGDPGPPRAGPPPAPDRPRQAARPPDAAAPRGPLRARILRPVLLRERPGGRVVRRIGTRTGYGSHRALAVVARRPGWVGVLTQHVANSRAAWIPAAAAELLRERYTLRADLSERMLVVRRDGRVVRRIAVAVGRPGTATPTGRFAVTDALLIRRGSGAYGCCVLALTGRQPNVPQGWSGGDRLAIHGTTNERTVGTRASSGCLRARDSDMRWLIARVRAGAPVRISA